MLTKADKTHWGERWYTDSYGKGEYGPPLVASLTTRGIVFLKKSNFRNRIPENLLVEIDIHGNLYGKNTVKTNQIETPDLNEWFQPPNRKKRIDYWYRVNVREVKTRIGLFVDAMPGKKECYMVTISFPSKVTDKQALKFRNRWETSMRKSGWLRHFLWITERQKNGTIHFHFAVFNRINVRRANRAMIAILRKEVMRGGLDYPRQYINKYNGVDLAKNRNTKKVFNFATNRGALANYLTKYLTKKKDPDYPPDNFSGRAWGCSQSLSNLQDRFRLTEKEYEAEKQKYNDQLEQVKIEDTEVSERIDFYKWKRGMPRDVRDLFADINYEIITRWDRIRGPALDHFRDRK